jgi:hypothetical protein
MAGFTYANALTNDGSTYAIDNLSQKTQETAGTFFHELGHNLNLRHGGGDQKPDYISSMSYLFQLPGIYRSDTAGCLPYSAVPPYDSSPCLNANGGAGPLYDSTAPVRIDFSCRRAGYPW